MCGPGCVCVVSRGAIILPSGVTSNGRGVVGPAPPNLRSTATGLLNPTVGCVVMLLMLSLVPAAIVLMFWPGVEPRTADVLYDRNRPAWPQE